MTLSEALEWQRINAHHINRLAKLGDKTALRLIDVYRTLYADQLNPMKQNEFMAVVDDYFRRDHMIIERNQLAERFGHKIPKNFRRIDS